MIHHAEDAEKHSLPLDEVHVLQHDDDHVADDQLETENTYLQSNCPHPAYASHQLYVILLYICVSVVLICTAIQAGREKLDINLDSTVFVSVSLRNLVR
jgi:hypothetical protein